jgi:hypothetical protein
MENHNGASCVCGVKTFVRNRYFYGKLLDVYHFDLEQNYLNAKRWMLNRLVVGYGVICGLDVQVGQDGKSVVVLPGIAVDKCGREIVVPQTSSPLPLPPPPQATAGASDSTSDECCDQNWVHLCICYHECPSDPVPGLGGECDPNTLCSPGSIRERYELIFNDGKLPDVTTDCSVPDLISGSKINYAALAQYVSAPCPECPDDPCIALANVRIPESGETLSSESIDIAVRPIVYTNDLLHDLLVCLTNKPAPQEYARGGKN